MIEFGCQTPAVLRSAFGRQRYPNQLRAACCCLASMRSVRRSSARRLDDVALARLRARARREGRSLEEECRLSLVAAAQRADLLSAVDSWRVAWPDDADLEDPFADVRPRGVGRTIDLS